MLVPTLLTLDVFWTKDGLKILELQHGRRSGSEGYRVLHGLNLRECLANPFIEELKQDGWLWENNPKTYDDILSETPPQSFARFVDGNHALDLVLTNKAFQSALLPGLKTCFPDEHIFTYHPDFLKVVPKIQAVFPDTDELVIKAPSQAVGIGIIPVNKSELESLTLDDWRNKDSHKQSMYGPAFTVQERVKPLPVQIEGETYYPPIRLWMALIPENGRLRPEFFNSGDLPPPIYYKLPAPDGTGTYRSQIISDIHTGRGVALVPPEIQQGIYAALARILPPSLEALMQTPMRDVVNGILNIPDDGAAALAFRFLQKNEPVLGQNFEGLEDVIDQTSHIFAEKYLRDEAFKLEINRCLSFDSFMATLLLPRTYRENTESFLFDRLSDVWGRASPETLAAKLAEAGLCLPVSELRNAFVLIKDDPRNGNQYGLRACALI